MLRDFWGFDGYARDAEGFLSWQHLTFVSALMVIMTILAVWLGRKMRNRSRREQNRVLIGAAILMDGIEIIKIILRCTLGGDPMSWLNDLPLYMCSIQFVTLPLAAFSKGRIKEASLDFLCIFGVLGALLGTYGAGNNYSCYPVISFHNVVSGITHSAAGFASLYIMITGMMSLKKENMWISSAIIGAFSIVAYFVNLALDTNYMFLMRGDGTPYEIVYGWVSGSPVLYPLSVVALFIVYIAAFYAVRYAICRSKAKKA